MNDTELHSIKHRAALLASRWNEAGTWQRGKDDKPRNRQPSPILCAQLSQEMQRAIDAKDGSFFVQLARAIERVGKRRNSIQERMTAWLFKLHQNKIDFDDRKYKVEELTAKAMATRQFGANEASIRTMIVSLMGQLGFSFVNSRKVKHSL